MVIIIVIIMVIIMIIIMITFICWNLFRVSNIFRAFSASSGVVGGKASQKCLMSSDALRRSTLST